MQLMECKKFPSILYVHCTWLTVAWGFSLLAFTLSHLLIRWRERSTLSALKKLPRRSDAYDEAYKQTMDGTGNQKSGFWELVKRTLSWLVCTNGPLTFVQLQHAHLLWRLVNLNSMKRTLWKLMTWFLHAPGWLPWIKTNTLYNTRILWTDPEHVVPWRSNWYRNPLRYVCLIRYIWIRLLSNKWWSWSSATVQPALSLCSGKLGPSRPCILNTDWSENKSGVGEVDRRFSWR